MFECPRCGNDAVYLADEVFSLIRCEFCGDAIDADVLLQDIDHIGRGVLARSGEELLPPWKQSSSEPLSAGAIVCCSAGDGGQHLTPSQPGPHARRPGRMAHRAWDVRL